MPLRYFMDDRRDRRCVGIARIGLIGTVILVSAGAVPALAGGTPPLGTPFSQLTIPSSAPSWLAPAWHGALNAALPSRIGGSPATPGSVPASSSATDPSGTLGILNTAGPTATAGNAFFQSLGTNGRSCATCHLPANGMGLAASAVAAQFTSFGATDPLFAPVDAATCPKNVAASLKTTSPDGTSAGSGSGASPTDPTPYTLLINKGLFRVALPLPTTVDFTLTVVNDPYGCNTDANYNQIAVSSGVTTPVVSTYRRPLMTANLKFKTITAADTGLFPSTGLTTDPFTGLPESGNLMADGREPTLQSQAMDATLLHAQALVAPSSAQIAQIVAFETSLYAAQTADTVAGDLTRGGNLGGPTTIAATTPGKDPPTAGPSFALYPNVGGGGGKGGALASIARGQAIFNTKSFSVGNVAGLNDVTGIGNPTGTTCAGCHRQTNAGTATVPNAAMDTGVGGSSSGVGGPPPSRDLPLFQIVCKAGSSTSFHNSTVVANDLGKAFFTGKCADAAKFTVPNLRALAARAPFFHDGSAATLGDVVNFYDRRFRIGLSPQERQDLVNFLSAL